jgi:hypothetical protein
VKLDVSKRLPGAGKRQLLVGGAVGVVERGFRRAALGDSAEVLDGQRRLEPAPSRTEPRLSELQQGREFAGAGARLRVIMV